MISYTSVTRIYQIAPILETDLPDLTSAEIVRHAEGAEAEINAAIARRYTLPLSPVPPLIETIADDIAIYRIFTRRVFSAEKINDSPWPDRYKEARDLLKQIADGELTLANSDGTVIAERTDLAEVWSSTQGYNSTFHEGADVDHVVDPDKVDDILDDRNI